MNDDAKDKPHSDEAAPEEIKVPTPPHPDQEFGLDDSRWSQDDWRALTTDLVESGMCTWKEIAALVLGHLNPSQFGTSLASSEGFKTRYGKGNTMAVVMKWAYGQTGRCADCGTRLELQADHIKGKETYENPLDADFIENMTLRCRRCNVIRRPSHEYGGLTFLTAEAALMWILLVIRPRTFLDYIRMCRLYGMTMADIRMKEAWAMARWLAKAEKPAYDIERNDVSSYDLVLWRDSAVTRVDPGFPLPSDATRLNAKVPGSWRLGFVAVHDDGRPKFHEQPLAFVPFSAYELGARPPQALCIIYRAPDRKRGVPQVVSDLPPRGTTLIALAVKPPDERFELQPHSGASRVILRDARTQGRLLGEVAEIGYDAKLF